MYKGTPQRVYDHYHNVEDLKGNRDIKNKSVLNDNDRILLLDSEGKFRFIYSAFSYLKTIFGVGGSTDRNVDGGNFSSVYLPTQKVDGGTF